MVTAADMKNIDKQMELLFEDKRLASFKSKWVFSDAKPCNAQKMAEAGFIFIGSRQEPDAVKCFMCGKCLDGWEEDDDPWTEHLKHNNNCKFAKQQLQEDLLTVDQFIELRDELFELVMTRIFQEKKEELRGFFDQLKENLIKL